LAAQTESLRRLRPGDAWVLRQDGVCAIQRASRPDHVDENRAALDVGLDRDDLAALDAEFPPPLHPQPLEML
jgi:diketogulonate reductase-like aldo/keto reductase